MSANSHIQWTDHTWNPWRGCRKVAPECQNCYITTTVPFRVSGQKHGSERVRASEATLKEPYKWNRILEQHNQRHGDNQRFRVFCLSLGDWLDDENIPIEWLAGLLRTIHDTPNLDWLLLTKRPQNFFARLSAAYESRRGTPESWMMRDWLTAGTELGGSPPENVWIGVSAGADQKAALSIPAKVHFLSCEPMLRPMDTEDVHLFDWVILGGESGSKARPCNIKWIGDAVHFCRINSIPCFVKQLGSKPYHCCMVHDRSPAEYSTAPLDCGGKCGYGCEPIKLNHSKGGDMDEWPEDLRIREFPTV